MLEANIDNSPRNYFVLYLERGCLVGSSNGGLRKDWKETHSHIAMRLASRYEKRSYFSKNA